MPFIDKLLTRDPRTLHALRLPLLHPFSTALGCAPFTFLAVLEFAGADVVAAVVSGGSVIAFRTVLRIAVFVVPALVGAATFGFCLIADQPVGKHEAARRAGNSKPDHAHS